MEMTVMTFNLRVNSLADGGNAWPYRVHAAAQTIEDSQASIVCTQEGLHSMLLDLQARLPDYTWIGQGREGDCEGEFNAIFYKHHEWKPLTTEHFWLSEEPERPGSLSWGSHYSRMCTWTLFESLHHSDKKCIVLNTHLDNGSQTAREQGAALVLRKLSELQALYKYPCILMGDMNAKADNTVIRFLRGVLQDGYSAAPGGSDDVGCTFHNYKGGEAGSPIDYIFATQQVKFARTYVERSLIHGKYASDHYPVISQLLL